MHFAQVNQATGGDEEERRVEKTRSLNILGSGWCKTREKEREREREV